MSTRTAGPASADAPAPSRRLALVGSPNSGKSTLFNGLTGLRAKTGNHPGVTVSRYQGVVGTDRGPVLLEDLPGTYSLDPISLDEQIVVDVLDPAAGAPRPDGIVVTLDATVLGRSLGLLAQVLQAGAPVCVVLTFTDELARRGGGVEVAALERALGVPVVSAVAGSRRDLPRLRELLAAPSEWSAPVVLPPTAPEETARWTASVLQRAGYRMPGFDRRTRRADAVLLHPVWGTAIFFVTMFAFFQVIFTVAAPVQDAIETAFGALGAFASAAIPIDWLASFVSGALIGGVGGVLVFLPQIALLFLMISLLEGVGYLARAAFLMDRVMARAGLEGRAFVALLSSLACAVPGIMATRTLPSARDRIATMMGAPLMTCSARLPVYVLLIGLLVPADARFGPIGLQGVVMFALYLLGAVSAMVAAWAFSRIGRGRSGPLLPFYMEMPPFRIPSARSVALAVRDSCLTFLRKVGKIILVTTVILWVLLNVPFRGDAELRAAGVDPGDQAASASYVIDHSLASDVGRFVEPVFEPLGFDWRIDVAVLASLSARETFVSTLGQVAAAKDPADPSSALTGLTVQDGPRAGEPLFTPPVLAALLVFFLYALQCMSTVGALRRESGSWRWPAIAFGYMFALAWIAGFAAYRIASAVTG
ncbi:ferrous iron transporter B [Amnibacterium endophyticum]|uniref:Ferrous iron transporter B n=1 Tax=Amnibacterium endophyticum TaxID=2109337 RepID=A0ABW4LBA4_9MICO